MTLAGTLLSEHPIHRYSGRDTDGSGASGYRHQSGGCGTRRESTLSVRCASSCRRGAQERGQLCEACHPLVVLVLVLLGT